MKEIWRQLEKPIIDINIFLQLHSLKTVFNKGRDELDIIKVSLDSEILLIILWSNMRNNNCVNEVYYSCVFCKI